MLDDARLVSFDVGLPEQKTPVLLRISGGHVTCIPILRLREANALLAARSLVVIDSDPWLPSHAREPPYPPKPAKSPFNSMASSAAILR